MDALSSNNAASDHGPLQQKRARSAISRHFKFARAGSRRPFFRGYHWAFAALGLVLLAEIIAAAIVVFSFLMHPRSTCLSLAIFAKPCRDGYFAGGSFSPDIPQWRNPSPF
ncbi:hypothetical protein GRI44_08440 [Altererythrobacter confluentis]|uniref:Uncharacterized protein n=1 Tax=Allopontixanthobacter confluentis TaxID=1849021 RepID=A0A6L7GH29_9SPHN|nr:hypothetical protein [Allopontixanthobacter confluentis]MXP14776.1 hypothetical protein [Allopontixanthobacter confluentis]